LLGKRVQPVSRALYNILQICQENRGMTGIKSIVSIVANLTGKIGTTGIENIVSIVVNLTGKRGWDS
jgi:hypothetical protein